LWGWKFDIKFLEWKNESFLLIGTWKVIFSSANVLVYITSIGCFSLMPFILYSIACFYCLNHVFDCPFIIIGNLFCHRLRVHLIPIVFSFIDYDFETLFLFYLMFLFLIYIVDTLLLISIINTFVEFFLIHLPCMMIQIRL